MCIRDSPVQGASFTLYQYGAVMKDAVITNAKGEWKITELPAGDYVLSQESSPCLLYTSRCV